MSLINQKSAVPLEYISYADYVLKLHLAAQQHQLKLQVIGYEKFEKIDQNYPLYQLSINPEAPWSVCVLAGIHGYEVAGPLSILHLINKGFFNHYQNVSFTLFPLQNPTSFDLKQRYDDDYRDLNALYKTTLKSKRYKEVQLFYDKVRSHQFDVFISLHEDFDQSDFYCYVFEDDYNRPIYSRFIKKIASTCALLTQKTLYNQKVVQGKIINQYDHSIEQFMFTSNKARFSLATETPMKLPLEERIRINQETLSFFARLGE